MAAIAMYGPVSATAQTGPVFQHLHGGLVNDIVFIDAQNGCAAEDGGKIRYSQNGGVTWNNAFVQDSYRGDLFSLSFVPDDQSSISGYCVGDGGIVLVSTDLGHSWTIANASPVTDVFEDQNANPQVTCGTHPAKLQGIFMKDSTHGWVVGLDGAYAVTSNGWQTWSRPVNGTLEPDYECSGSMLDLYKIHFFYDANPASGHSHWETGVMLSEYGNTLITHDGGASWEYSNCYPQSMCPWPQGNVELWSMAFSDPLESNSTW